MFLTKNASQLRLLVAYGAGAGMAAAYGVPLGGALFALEVLRGMLALRLVLPALLASLIATTISWLALPNAPTNQIPPISYSAGALTWALIIGPLSGIVSVAYVRIIAWADRNKPKRWRRVVVPVIALGMFGLISVKLPQLLGNGRDLAQLLITGGITTSALLLLLFFSMQNINKLFTWGQQGDSKVGENKRQGEYRRVHLNSDEGADYDPRSIAGCPDVPLQPIESRLIGHRIIDLIGD